MSSAHDGGCAILLPDGRILIAGGSDANGPTAGGDIFNTDGTWSSAPAMISPRVHQACAVLPGGQVLAAGGLTTGNAITNSAELFNLSANAWTQLPAMTQARAGATASLLPDGRVLLGAGQTSSGPSNTLEIFDPKSQTFSFAGILSAARQDAAATVLHDGRVLIVGGTGPDANGNPTVLASSDIYDPFTGSVSSGPALNLARSKHSATTQLDGKVVVIGGNDGSNDLASIEVYDPAAGGNFTVLPAVLGTPRSGHLAFLLPNNNEVMVAGGQSAGVGLASAELYVPWGNQGSGAVQATGTMSAARSQASGASLSAVNGLTLMAGGSAQNSAELYSFATVNTDQSDYAPGTPVTITGSGWQPGETVTLTLVESPLIDTHAAMTAVADQNGNIFNNQFSPDSYDVSVRFYLTATGSKSQAQNTFTDGNASSVSGAVTSSATSNPISGATITCTSGCTNTTPPPTTTSDTTGEYIFDGKGGDGPKLTFNGNGPASITLTASAPGFNSATITFTANNNQSYVENFSLTPACTPASITGQPQNQTVTYGQTATFSASATGTAPLSYQWLKNGSGVTGATSSSYSFAPNVSDSGSSFSVQVSNACTSPAKLSSSASLTVNPALATVTLGNLSQTYSGSPEPVTVTTNPNGLSTSVTYNGSSTAPTAAGSYAVVASVTDPNYTGSASGTLVIGQASQTITFATIPTHTYGDPAFAVIPTASSGLAVSLSASGNCTLSGSAAPANVTITGAGSCSITASQPGNTNYLAATPATQSFSINKANATITVTPYNVTYDGGSHTATATAVGVNNANLLSELDLSGTIHTNAGNYSDTWVFTDTTGNYNDASGVVSDIISKANAAIVVTPYDVVYDATSHSATGSATGVNGSNLTAELNLTGTAHTNAGTYTDAWSFTDLSGNYNNAAGTVTNVIEKAKPTIVVTPYDVFYDGNAHMASGSATGVGGAALAGLNLSATVHTNAGSYADGWTFTDATGNYYNAAGTVNDVIEKATPTLAWSTPADISYGTALSGTQLNATATGVRGAVLTGTFAYNPPVNTVLSAAPNQPLVVLFTPTDPNYTSNNATVSINVNQATPRIVWSNPADITYGTALGNTQLNAIAPAMPVGVTGWWTADENTGTTAHNAVGADSATLKGATWAPGKYNSAFLLAAANQQYVDAGNTPDLQVSHGDFSVAVWVYFNSLTGDMSIVDKMGSVANDVNDDGWRLLKQGNNNFWFCIGQQGSGNMCLPNTMAHSQTVATTGQWYFVVATKTATAVSIYVNGTLEGSGNVGPIYDQDDTNLRFGSYAAQGAYLDGLIDEPMLFNHALSAAEVQALYGQQPGNFAYTPASGTVLNAGQNQKLSATFTPSDPINFATSAASVQINVLKADATINVTGYGVTYDGNSHTATGTATGVKGEALPGVDLSATTHTNAGTYTDTWTFTDSTGNYNNATGSVTDSIAKANAAITVTAYSVTYDGNAHTATGTATGVKGETLAGLDLGGTTHTNAGTYPDSWTFTDSTGNYNNASGSVTDSIAKATPVLKWSDPSSIVYGTALSGTQLNATATGVNNSSLPGVFTYAPSAGAVLPVGVQKLSVSFAPTDSVDYVSPVSKSVSINVTYGVCPLIPQNPPSAIKSGATYPIKLYLCDSNGNDVSSSAVVVHATQIVLTSSVTGTPDDAGNSNPDLDFRYDSTLGPSGGYIYNLQTKGLVSGTWTMLFGAGYNASTGTYADPANSTHTIQFGVK